MNQNTATTFIPVGCIAVPQAQSNLTPEEWELEELRTWNQIWIPHGITPQHGSDQHPLRHLRRGLQVSLLEAPVIRTFLRLIIAQWVSLEFRVHPTIEGLGTVRVYLLPDDVSRRTIDRSDVRLKKNRQHLLQSLDYSREAWDELGTSLQASRPISFNPEEGEDEQNVSLLQLFNQIPSPRPDPDSILNRDCQDSMHDVLESNVPGLKTTLYAYQRRSVAVMLQKEAQPERVVDPRLLHARAHDGSGWYLDPVAGTILLEPRYYEGISGGILAEEMGSGKTLMCLSLILATRHLPTMPPELYGPSELPVRKRVASLADMAAACISRNSIPWKSYYNVFGTHGSYSYDQCVEAITRNPAYYWAPPPQRREREHDRPRRSQNLERKERLQIYLSAATFIVVPNNLVAQWRQEIEKHTTGLDVVVVAKGDDVPCLERLRDCDMILFSQSRFEGLPLSLTPLSRLHFKRCIVDEGHKLGNSRINHQSNLVAGLNLLRFSSRWIVTGTPSRGLFGVDSSEAKTASVAGHAQPEALASLEKADLERIGAITSLYLKARPWANTAMETGDTRADWGTYLMLPRHNSRARGRWHSLKSTLDSLIIRHRLAEVGELLPPVDEKIVVLGGSYQDRLSLNLFSMMIIFNSVQSQRTDADYFFHHKQRKSLQQIVYNLKQSSFFGGSFFTSEEIATSVKTAEEFLEEGKIPISSEDEALLRSAIAFGHLSMEDKLRNLSNQFHEIPVSVVGFPGGSGSSWSLDGGADEPICTSASMLLALQKKLYTAAKDPEKLNSLLNGGLFQAGLAERDKLLVAESSKSETAKKDGKSQTLAGNTKLGTDSAPKARSHGGKGSKPEINMHAELFSGPLELTRITATTSSKLSYLVNGIVKHQDKEKIIVFYDNDNVAWYLASMLDVLQVQHLIYAKSLSTERKAEYIDTFHHNPTFRVLLMELSQAAFGLDMREASRIYFINPVLNPQVEAQAIGRVRRISQRKPVSVETLVLKDSIDEVILERKKHMTQAEHRQVKSLLDVRPIYNWIKNATITPMPDSASETAHFAPLEAPQKVFDRGFGGTVDPNEGIILADDTPPGIQQPPPQPQPLNGFVRMAVVGGGVKREYNEGPGSGEPDEQVHQDVHTHVPRKVRFAVDVADG